MNFLDMLGGHGIGEDAGPASPAPADLMDLLMRPEAGNVQPQPSPTAPASPTGLPPASPVDNSMVLPLMLLRAAAEVSQRRAPGQSKTNQNLTALHNAALAGMDLKGQNEARANQNRKLQMEEAVTSQNLSTAQQNQAQNAELHPLKVQAARLGITEAELKTKIEQKTLDWTDRLKQAQLERDNAATEASKAAASAKVMQAESALQKNELLARQLGLQGARLELDASRAAAQAEQRDRQAPKRWQDANTGASGWSWMDGGKMYQQQDPMDRLTAMKQLEKQMAYEKEMSAKHNIPYTSPTAGDIQKTLQQLTTARISVFDNGTWRPVDDRKVDPTGTPQATPQKGGVDTRAVMPKSDPEYVNILAQLKANAGKGVQTSDGRQYVLGPDGQSVQYYNAPVHDKPKDGTPAPAAPASAPAVSGEFELKLKQSPDTPIKGPDGKMYMWNPRKKEVENLGEDKPYKRIFEP